MSEIEGIGYGRQQWSNTPLMVRTRYRFVGRDGHGWYLWSSETESMTCPSSYFWASTEVRVRLQRLRAQARYGLPAGRQSFRLTAEGSLVASP